jgi:hypothetical protein
MAFQAHTDLDRFIDVQRSMAQHFLAPQTFRLIVPDLAVWTPIPWSVILFAEHIHQLYQHIF